MQMLSEVQATVLTDIREEVLRSRVSIFPVSEVPVAGSVRFSNNSSAGQAADVHVAATGQVSAVRVEIPAT